MDGKIKLMVSMLVAVLITVRCGEIWKCLNIKSIGYINKLDFKSEK